MIRIEENLRENSEWQTIIEYKCDFCGNLISEKNSLMEMTEEEDIKRACFPKCLESLLLHYGVDISGEPTVEHFFKFKARRLEYVGDCVTLEICEDGELTSRIKTRKGKCNCLVPLLIIFSDDKTVLCQACYRYYRK